MPIKENTMVDKSTPSEKLSPWWRRSVIIVLVIGFAVLIWMAIRAHKDAPPIPEKVVGPSGETIFTRDDILAGQEVFLKHGLMENGTIWGHGAYLGPDFSAEYLHTLAIDARDHLAKQYYQREWPNLSSAERAAIGGEVQQLLKQNRYNGQIHTLILSPPEVMSYRSQIGKWTEYFSQPALNRGLMNKQVKNPKELQQLTAFFAWTAWASE